MQFWTTDFCNCLLPVQASSVKYENAVSSHSCMSWDLRSVVGVFCQHLHTHCSIKFHWGFNIQKKGIAPWVFTLCLRWGHPFACSWKSRYRSCKPEVPHSVNFLRSCVSYPRALLSVYYKCTEQSPRVQLSYRQLSLRKWSCELWGNS